MAINWVQGFFIPVVEICFIMGIVGAITWIVVRAFFKIWERDTKWFFKYSILKKEYPQATVKWVMDCIEGGIGYYDAKKILMVKMYPKKQINETMYIFDKILEEMKGGEKNNGRKFKVGNRKIENTTTELPDI